ncbi:hypothetical protein C0J52_25275 [Blattella germanica]|nr:hypothetical protein C0J52_25275 [Blattella germanica]
MKKSNYSESRQWQINERVVLSLLQDEPRGRLNCSSCFHLGHGPLSEKFATRLCADDNFPDGKSKGSPRPEICDARKRKSSKKQIQSRETNIFDFMRLLIMRLVYGIASSMGFGESISGFLGGIFVPPGVDDDDYGDFDF